MPNSLSSNQIQQLQTTLATGDVNSVYSYLSQQGYAYAGWAGGVAAGNTIAGVAALEYLKGTALMGVGGPACQNLSSERIQAIKTDMADAYLKTLLSIANDPANNGYANRDIKAKEVWNFHKKVFEDNGLSIDNWTLNAPFKIIQKLQGDQGLEQYWEFMRETKGADSYDATVANLATLAFMHKQAASSDPEISSMANAWMQNVPGIYDWNQIGSSFDIALTVLKIKAHVDPEYNVLNGTYDPLGNFIGDLTSTSFAAAQSFIPRRDPLVLDLDGDGLETVGPAQSGVLFDHNADGIKTGTGWVKSDDGFLVMDRNGNGNIDSGRELFGDATLLYTGGTAADGFVALAQEDSNSDGKITSADNKWSSLRIWRDLNQDGVSQTNELSTMQNAGIASINVAKAANSVTLANGNQIADLGTYTKTDGTSGTVGETSQMADINLAQDTFRSEFSDQIPVDADVAAMPDIKGSGLVRDLHQAASMDTSAGNALKAKLAEFTAATTGAQQKALLDDLLLAWADTSTTIARMQDRNPSQVTVVWANPAVQAQWESKLHILEAFNGRYFFALPGDTLSGALSGLFLSAPDAQGKRTATVDFFSTQLDQLQQGVDALKESVYASLVLQTRLKPVIDKIQLTVDDSGVHFDFSQLDAELTARLASNAVNGLTDMVDLARYAQPVLGSTGYDAWAKPEDAIRSGTVSDETLNALNIKSLEAANDTVSGTSAAEQFFGGGGNDSLSGAAGGDVLIGGKGDDVLTGGTGSDSYVFRMGDGYDTLNENANEGIDVLQLGVGLDVASTQINRENMDLVLVFNTADKVRISNYFLQNRIEQIQFADGTTWDFATVTSKLVYKGTADADSLYGLLGVSNRINGLDGSDTINGADRDDVLNGDAGNDSVSGGNGNDTLTGGAGNDALNGGYGSDTYVFNLGDGADTISDYDYTNGNSDKLQFGAGITADAIQLDRSGHDLILTVNANDKVTLQYYFYDGSNRVETIAFADGTTWDYATVGNKLVYNGTANADSLSGAWDVTNRINGLDGNDTITGAAKDDVLSGDAGNDSVSGGSGYDTLAGGSGNDSLDGGFGNDTYVFNLGDGADTISDYDYTNGNSDKLQFGAGITADAIQLDRSGYDLILSVNASDKVTLKYYFYDGSNRVETIAFADGTTWDYATVGNKLVYNGTANADSLSGAWDVTNRINGLDGNDTITGAAKDDVLNGDAGSDSLSGGYGNDTLTGGAGNDALNGGYGSDTYVFNLGDGADTINDYDYNANTDKLQFGVGITADAIQLDRSDHDLILSVNASDKVTLKNYFYYDSNYRVETIAFADGTTWDYTTVGNKQLVYNGTADADSLSGASGVTNRINGLAGNDTISGADKDDVLNGDAGNDSVSGGNGNDMLTGGSGNDTLDGGYGNDTYVFNLGDGVDTIGDYDNLSGNSDKLQFGVGITADAVQLDRIGDDLILSVNASDKVTLKNYFYYDSNYQVETVAFVDGTTWDYTTVGNKLVYNGTANADSLSGASGVTNRISGLDGNDTIRGADKDDVLNGDAGNDSVSGNNGSDTLAGGIGNDTLDGGYGNDTYVFNLGDGVDTIGDYDNLSGNSDKLQFGVGITADAIQLDRSGNDLILSVNASDKVTLQNYFYYDSNYRVETVAFADGTTWDYTTVGNKLIYNGTANADSLSGVSGVINRINGLGGNDTISGADKNDVLNGDADNDSVSGGNGNDTLTGGSGNDTLDGGYGSDTYVFNLGDGVDTISDYDNLSGNSDRLQFGVGITADAVQLDRIGNDLILSVNANDKVTLQNYFYYDSNYRVETIAFADGTTWDIAKVAGVRGHNGTEGNDYFWGVSDVSNRINGLSGNDTIYGGDKDDTLTGGAGNDILSGGTGNDVFKFASPDQGTDSISDFTSGSDVIQIVGSSFGLQPGVAVSLLTGTTTPSASGTAPQFLYNTTTGSLYFDQDGAESAYNAVSIVTLTGQKNLVAADIVVVEA